MVGMSMKSLDSSIYFGSPPLRRLGQNFLIDRMARDLIVNSADLHRSDVVLEVGPGKGFLTETLLSHAGKVIAIEKDPRLVTILRHRHGRNRRLRIIQGDILKVKLPRFNKVVCSPPYYISSRLVLLLVSKRFRRAVLTLQKEFAERLAAKPGSPDYGRISVMVQHKSSIELAGVIGRDSFRPVPRVDSAVVVMRKKKPEVPVRSERLFGDLVRFMFTQRRKKAKKVLRQYFETPLGQKDLKNETPPSLPDVRVFQLRVSDFEQLSNEISMMKREHLE
jgi:16S rRNA (adenine1518-N6/adenine1519-N6)-dimethyltransferase